MRILISAALMALAMGSVTKAEPTYPELNGRLVVDNANLLSDASEAAIAEELHNYSVKYGPQIAVVTMPSLEGADPVDYGNRLFRHLGLGDAKRNDGVLLLITMAERKSRIEVGYGLEPQLTDAEANRINTQVIVPAFKRKDFEGGIAQGVGAIEEVVKPQPVETVKANHSKGESLGWIVSLFSTGLVGAAVWAIYSSMRRRRRERKREGERLGAMLAAQHAMQLKAKRDAEISAAAAEADRRAQKSSRGIKRPRPSNRLHNDSSDLPYYNGAPSKSPTARSNYEARQSANFRPVTARSASTVSTVATATVAAEAARRERERQDRIRRENDEAAARRRRRDEEDAAQRRRNDDSYSNSSSSSWGSSDSGSSSSDSGGGGSSGGGGDTGSW